MRSQVDVVQFMDEMVQRLEVAIASLNLEGEEDVFSRHCYFWKSIRPSILARLGQQDRVADNTMVQTANPANDAIEIDLLNWDFFDNEWLSSMNWLGAGMPQPAL